MIDIFGRSYQPIGVSVAKTVLTIDILGGSYQPIGVSVTKTVVAMLGRIVVVSGVSLSWHVTATSWEWEHDVTSRPWWSHDSRLWASEGQARPCSQTGPVFGLGRRELES